MGFGVAAGVADGAKVGGCVGRGLVAGPVVGVGPVRVGVAAWQAPVVAINATSKTILTIDEAVGFPILVIFSPP